MLVNSYSGYDHVLAWNEEYGLLTNLSNLSIAVVEEFYQLSFI